MDREAMKTIALLLAAITIFSLILYTAFFLQNSTTSKENVSELPEVVNKVHSQSTVLTIFNGQQMYYPKITSDINAVFSGFGLARSVSDENKLLFILSELRSVNADSLAEDENAFLHVTKQLLLLDLNLITLKKHNVLNDAKRVFEEMRDINRLCSTNTNSILKLADFFSQAASFGSTASKFSLQYPEKFQSYYGSVHGLERYFPISEKFNILGQEVNKLCINYAYIGEKLSKSDNIEFLCKNKDLLKSEVSELNKRVSEMEKSLTSIEAALNSLPEDVRVFFRCNIAKLKKLRVSISVISAFIASLESGALC